MEFHAAESPLSHGRSACRDPQAVSSGERSPNVIGRMEQVDASIARYLRALDRADREESDVAEAKSVRLKEKIAGLRRQMRALKVMEQTVQV